MKEFVSNSPEETKKIAFDLASRFSKKENGACVVGLYGELGSGKTTFMKYFAEALGVEENVASPTFVIERIYALKGSSFSHLIHIDAYRLESGEELNKLGWQEILADPGNLICIEWPERVSEIMPEHFMIRFEHGEDQGKNGGNTQENTKRKISFA